MMQVCKNLNKLLIDQKQGGILSFNTHSFSITTFASLFTRIVLQSRLKRDPCSAP